MTMTRFERWAVWLTTAATLATGVAYWWMRELLTPPDPWAVVNHPFQPWLLKAHILAAPAMVFSVGMITSRHVWRHFRIGVRTGRRSGLAAAAAFVVLVGTGYALQVVTPELLLRVLGWAHLLLGIGYSVGLMAHWPATRNPTTRAAASGPTGTSGPRAALGGTRGPGHDHRRRRGKAHRRDQVSN